MTKKKVLHEALKLIDDQIADACYQSVLISALTLPSVLLSTKNKDHKVFHNPFVTEADLICLSSGNEYATQKKDPMVRHKELVKIVQKPLEMFFEEKL